jgi:hypothetical protein
MYEYVLFIEQQNVGIDEFQIQVMTLLLASFNITMDLHSTISLCDVSEPDH